MIADQFNHASDEVNAVATSAIELQWYIDIYLDVEGWFAFGHHHPQTFVAAVAAKTHHPMLSAHQVKQVWAKLHENNFEISECPAPDLDPVTLIELDDVDQVFARPRQFN
jgi:hypothetical protein